MAKEVDLGQSQVLRSLHRLDTAILILPVRLDYLLYPSKCSLLRRFAGDFLAGITVASMLIPQSVSYASSLAKLSPVTGLFSAAFPALAYALLGTSRQLNV